MFNFVLSVYLNIITVMKNTSKNALANQLKAICNQLGLPVCLLSVSVFQIYGEEQTVNVDFSDMTCFNVTMGIVYPFTMEDLSSLLQSIYRIDEFGNRVYSRVA